MMKYTVYVLKSEKDGKRYIGVTEKLERRLDEHERGIVKSTRNRGPFILVHTEKFDDKKAAWAREKFFKTGKGREYLKSLNL